MPTPTSPDAAATVVEAAQGANPAREARDALQAATRLLTTASSEPARAPRRSSMIESAAWRRAIVCLLRPPLLIWDWRPWRTLNT